MLSAEQEARLYRLVGQRVRERRKGKLTQGKLAQIIQIARTSLTNFERGKQRLPLHLLLRIADALKCELSDLVPNRSQLGLLEDKASVGLHEVSVVGGQFTPTVRELVARYTTPEANK